MQVHQTLLFVALASLLFFSFGCVDQQGNFAPPYGTSQFINRTTDLNYTKFVNGDYNGMFLVIDNNKLSVMQIDINSYNIDWNKLINFPSGCGVNQAVKIVGSSLVCINLPTDTNWQTSWTTFDANMKAQYRKYTIDLNTTLNVSADGNLRAGGGYLSDGTTKYKISDLNRFVADDDTNYWKRDGTSIATGNWLNMGDKYQRFQRSYLYSGTIPITSNFYLGEKLPFPAWMGDSSGILLQATDNPYNDGSVNGGFALTQGGILNEFGVNMDQFGEHTSSLNGVSLRMDMRQGLDYWTFQGTSGYQLTGNVATGNVWIGGTYMNDTPNYKFSVFGNANFGDVGNGNFQDNGEKLIIDYGGVIIQENQYEGMSDYWNTYEENSLYKTSFWGNVKVDADLNVTKTTTLKDLNVSGNFKSNGTSRIANDLNIVKNIYQDGNYFGNQIYGNLYGEDITQNVTLNLANTYYDFNSGLSGDGVNGFSFDRNKLKATFKGRYLVNWSLSFMNNQSDQTIAGLVGVNSTQVARTENATRAKENGVEYSISGSGLVDMNVGQWLGFMLENETGAGSTVTIKHATLTATRIGN